MRIVFIGPVYPFRGGIVQYTTYLAREIRRCSHTLLLISFKRQYPRWLFPGHSDRDPSQSSSTDTDSQYQIDSLNPWTWFTTFRQIARFRPEIIVLQWWTIFWAPLWITIGLLNRLFLRTNLLFICHNVLPHETRPWHRPIARYVLGLGSYFIVQTAEEETRLKELIPNAKSSIVGHPDYDSVVDSLLSQREAREQLGLNQDAAVLLFFGIVRKYKGLSELLDAFAIVRTKIEDAMLLIAGEFWENRANYLTQIEQLALTDAVLLDDRYVPDEEVPLYFCAADLLVAPYRYMTGSGVTKLAKSYGLPVLMGNGLNQQLEGKTSNPTKNEQTLCPSYEEQIEQLAAEIVAYFETHQSKTDQKGEPDRAYRSINNQTDETWMQLVNILESVARSNRAT